MNIKELLIKLSKDEEFTDEEKNYLKTYDPEKAANDAAAAARRKAEEESAKTKTTIDELTAKIKELQESSQKKEEEKLTETQKLSKQVEALTKNLEQMKVEKEQAETARAKTLRSQLIRDTAKANGINPADKINNKLFYDMLETALADINTEDETAFKTALETFKSENAGMIAGTGKIVPGSGGTPNIDGLNPGQNPFAKETENKTLQFKLMNEKPDEARRLAIAAGVDISKDLDGNKETSISF